MVLNDFSSTYVCLGLTLYDACILGCMLLNVSTKGTIAAFETMGISFAESHFDMYNSVPGIIVGCCGSLGVISLLSMGFLASHLSDIQMIVSGMAVTCVGVLSLCFLEEDLSNPKWYYVASIFLIYSIGYPIGHTAIMGLFSKSKFSFLDFKETLAQSYSCFLNSFLSPQTNSTISFSRWT